MAPRYTTNDCWNNALKTNKTVFNRFIVPELHPEQVEALEPISHGKSLIFQAVYLIFNALQFLRNGMDFAENA